MIIDVLAILLIFSGLVFFLGGSLGLVRFPDFYTRMHAAGKSDTLSTLLMVSGFALYHAHEVIEALGQGDWYKPVFVIFKLMGICFFIMFTSPTSTHALIESGYKDGIDPRVERDDFKGAMRLDQ